MALAPVRLGELSRYQGLEPLPRGDDLDGHALNGTSALYLRPSGADDFSKHGSIGAAQVRANLADRAYDEEAIDVVLCLFNGHCIRQRVDRESTLVRPCGGTRVMGLFYEK